METATTSAATGANGSRASKYAPARDKQATAALSPPPHSTPSASAQQDQLVEDEEGWFAAPALHVGDQHKSSRPSHKTVVNPPVHPGQHLPRRAVAVQEEQDATQQGHDRGPTGAPALSLAQRLGMPVVHAPKKGSEQATNEEKINQREPDTPSRPNPTQPDQPDPQPADSTTPTLNGGVNTPSVLSGSASRSSMHSKYAPKPALAPQLMVDAAPAPEPRGAAENAEAQGGVFPTNNTDKHSRSDADVGAKQIDSILERIRLVRMKGPKSSLPTSFPPNSSTVSDPPSIDHHAQLSKPASRGTAASKSVQSSAKHPSKQKPTPLTGKDTRKPATDPTTASLPASSTFTVAGFCATVSEDKKTTNPSEEKTVELDSHAHTRESRSKESNDRKTTAKTKNKRKGKNKTGEEEKGETKQEIMDQDKTIVHGDIKSKGKHKDTAEKDPALATPEMQAALGLKSKSHIDVTAPGQEVKRQAPRASLISRLGPPPSAPPTHSTPSAPSAPRSSGADTIRKVSSQKKAERTDTGQKKGIDKMQDKTQGKAQVTNGNNVDHSPDASNILDTSPRPIPPAPASPSKHSGTSEFPISLPKSQSTRKTHAELVSRSPSSHQSAFEFHQLPKLPAVPNPSQPSESPSTPQPSSGPTTSVAASAPQVSEGQKLDKSEVAETPSISHSPQVETKSKLPPIPLGHIDWADDDLDDDLFLSSYSALPTPAPAPTSQSSVRATSPPAPAPIPTSSSLSPPTPWRTPRPPHTSRSPRSSRGLGHAASTPQSARRSPSDHMPSDGKREWRRQRPPPSPSTLPSGKPPVNYTSKPTARSNSHGIDEEKVPVGANRRPGGGGGGEAGKAGKAGAGLEVHEVGAGHAKRGKGKKRGARSGAAVAGAKAPAAGAARPYSSDAKSQRSLQMVETAGGGRGKGRSSKASGGGTGP